MSRVADGNKYEDVFVFEDLVYAMEWRLGVVHVYRNRNNALIKLHDVRYFCKCNASFLSHSIIGTNMHIIQCCAGDKLVFIRNRSGELLRTIPIADFPNLHPILCQVDVNGNFLIADRLSKCLLIAHVDQPNSQWRVVNLPDSPGRIGCRGVVWFRHKLYVAGSFGRLLTLHVWMSQALRTRHIYNPDRPSQVVCSNK